MFFYKPIREFVAILNYAATDARINIDFIVSNVFLITYSWIHGNFEFCSHGCTN